MRPSHRPLIVFLAVAVVVIAGAVATVVLWPRTEHATGPAPVISLTGHQVCADDIVIRVETDETMRQIAEVVRNDHRAQRLYSETKQEALVRFREIFKDSPDLVRSARVEALPASITVLPVEGADLHAWVTQLSAAFPAATSIEALVRDEIAAKLGHKYGAPSPCPPSGEF